ncbi:MAG: helix-turn-helix domain-containing protein [Oscillospiraceae bacterium]|nr:helix-turn-helix domain-containing protein [Oscillospiraceae bacterium]
MNISIDENLKKLRKQKGNTQQQLAEHLNMSVQSVSKWECGEGYPDITLIPAIALYYNVTSDQLLGMEEHCIKAKINEYNKKCEELFTQDEHDENVLALWREAQKEFPNNHIVLYSLMASLHWKYKEDESYNEMIEIGERLLRESADNFLRLQTIQFLCFVCGNKRRGDLEISKKYADMNPQHWYCREELYVNCLPKDDEESIRNFQSSIRDYVEAICRFADEMAFSPNSDAKKSIKILEFTLNLRKLLYNDGDFACEGLIFYNLYNLACFNLQIGDAEKSLSYIAEMPGHFIKSCTPHELKRHTSFMVNRLEYGDCNISEDHKPNKPNKIAATIQRIFDNAKIFNSIRTDERYIAAVEIMKKVEP